MDKRLVGEWYKEEFGETINIFDENPPRMKMSISETGYYNFEPNTVYENGEYFCYEMNDTYHRAVYRVKFDNGNLVGFYTQYGKETPVIYTKISDSPKDEPFRYRPTEIYLPKSDLTRSDLLKKYASYKTDCNDTPYTTEYVLGGEIPPILNKYDYGKYVDGFRPNDDALAFSLLAFVCDHFGHDGCGGSGRTKTIKGLIEFCETHNMKSNCRGLAILLAELLRLNGIRARHITCLPYECPCNDCHVVVDCELPSGTRIMLDPTQRLYYKDEKGNFVSLRRLRNMLLAGEKPIPNCDASYNGEGFNADENIEYMTKNTLCFSRGVRYADDSDDDDVRCVELVPKEYPTEKFPERYRLRFVYDEEMFWRM